MSEPKWEVNEACVEDHWLPVRDTENGLAAQVKRDGCVNFSRYHNGASPDDIVVDAANVNYIHICDLDEMIASLQALKAKALEHFGETWPGWH